MRPDRETEKSEEEAIALADAAVLLLILLFIPLFSLLVEPISIVLIGPATLLFGYLAVKANPGVFKALHPKMIDRCVVNFWPR